MIRKTIVDTETNGLRLDEALARSLSGMSRSEARRIIDRGGCAVNAGMVRVASRQVKSGDVIEVGVMEPGRFRDLLLPAEAVLYEDGDLIAVNKPAGVNTQRTPYQLKGTLEYWIAERFRQSGSVQPCRVIHRLDRGTSGVMLFPKHQKSAAALSKAFHDGLVEKVYLAAVSGLPGEPEWRRDGPIGKVGTSRYGVMQGGKSASTEFRTVATADSCALVEARPLTGRTHQIRVHLQASGMPIVGDATYGGIPAARMMLHCASLTFPVRDGQMTVEAPLDAEFTAFLQENGLS